MMEEVQALLRKAERSLDAAETLHEHGDDDFAVSRAYYGCFYVAEALLLARGLQFSRHGQVIGQFGRLFAKTGLLDPQFHRLLDRALRFRHLADYAADPKIDPAVVVDVIRQGRAFLAAARVHLGGSSTAD